MIVVIVEMPETGLTEVTVGIDFILETMIIETITGKATTEAPVEIGILAEKDMIDPMTEKLVSTVTEPITLQSIATSSKELTYNYYKEINEPNPDKSETAQRSQADDSACYYEHPTN